MPDLLGHCVLCKQPVHECAVAHLIPDSLGGEYYGVLPEGIECSSCNRYYGQKIEQVVLGAWPLLPHRTLLQLPTKKKKAARVSVDIGEMSSTGIAGRVILDLPQRVPLIDGGSDRIVARFPAQQSDFEAACFCRWLLKIGIERIAMASREQALASRYDMARRFSRSPNRGDVWGFALDTDLELIQSFWKNGLNEELWKSCVNIEIEKHQNEEWVVLGFFGISAVAPLTGIRRVEFQECDDSELRIRRVVI